MDELVKKLEQIINQCATEELGSRLSQFAMISFKIMILNDMIKHSDNTDKYGTIEHTGVAWGRCIKLN